MTRDQWCAISYIDRHNTHSSYISDFIRAIDGPQIELTTESEATMFYRVYRNLRDSESKLHIPGVEIIMTAEAERVIERFKKQFEWIKSRSIL